MGKIKDGIVRGPVGKQVFRELNGEQIVQSKPGEGQTRMSPITMGFARGFGTASSLALNIRGSFQKSINGFYDGKMVNRLNSELGSILKESKDMVTGAVIFDEHSFSRLSAFDFNLSSPMREQVGFQVQTSLEAGELQVNIPQIQIPSQLKFPPGSNRCEIMLSLILMRPLEGYRLQYPERRIVTALREQVELTDTTFSFSVPEGCLYILALSLKYTLLRGTTERLINHKHFNPVTIIEAYITPGVYTADDELEWIDMPNVKAS